MKTMDPRDGRFIEAYRAGGEKAGRRQDCPADEEIWAASQGDLPRERVGRLLDHARECAACAESFRVAAVLCAEARPAAGGGEPSRRVVPIRARWRIASIAAGLAAAILAVAVLRLVEHRRSGPPDVALAERVRTGLWRSGAARDEPLPDRWAIGPGDRLYLMVESDIPVHLYVLNRDPAGAVTVLFPSPDAQWRNPLMPGRRHRLPGDSTWEYDSWEVSEAAGAEELVVIAARSPVVTLDSALAEAGREDSAGGVLRGSGSGPATSGIARALDELMAAPAAPSDRMIREFVLEHRP